MAFGEGAFDEGLASGDPLAVMAAVRRCADRLRSEAWEPAALERVVEKLSGLAKDASPRVRQSVAEAAPYLPEGAFSSLIPALAKDRSPYVRDAAERAVRKRTEIRRAAADGEEHDARVERWYAALDKKGARAIARRIASHETEYFVRRMHHEARSSFMGFTETVKRLREGLEAPAIDRAELRALVDRLDERFRFFQHVLETGRTHAQPAEPEFRPTRLAPLLSDEVALLAARFPDRAGRLEVDLTAVDPALSLEADPNFLRQAFGNILRNAVEAYAERTGPIRVRIAAQAAGAHEAVVAITDSGCGMHANDVARAFVPFGSSKPGGTGFGLFLARRIARAVHGGDLTLVSTLGVGTQVTMTLPLDQERPRSSRSRARRRS